MKPDTHGIRRLSFSGPFSISAPISHSFLTVFLSLAMGLWIPMTGWGSGFAEVLLGNWSVTTINGCQGTIHITNASGGSFTGEINIDEGNTEDLTDGSFDGTRASFNRIWRGWDLSQHWSGELKTTPEGILSIEGELEGAGGSTEFTMLKSETAPPSVPTHTPTARIDSGLRFTSITGQVETSPDPDEVDWLPATLRTVIYVGDHIMTGDKSRAGLMAEDQYQFVLREKSEVIALSPPEKETKLGLVMGRLWTNTKKVFTGGTLEIEMGQAVAGIKGTTFICEYIDGISSLTVLEGVVELSHKVSGQQVMVSAGELAEASVDGIFGVRRFDALAEKDRWTESQSSSEEPKHQVPTNLSTSEAITLFDNSSTGGVQNDPTKKTLFTLTQPARITYLRTYHYNNGAGAAPGTITLWSENGDIFGPYPTTGMGGGRLPVLWFCEPNEDLPAGTYTVIDSDPSTWSHNAISENAGITWVSGILLSHVNEMSMPDDESPSDDGGPHLGNQDLDSIFTSSYAEFEAHFAGQPLRVEGTFLQRESASRAVVLEVGDGRLVRGAGIQNGTPNAFEEISSFSPAWISGVIYRMRPDSDRPGTDLLILESGGTFGCIAEP